MPTRRQQSTATSFSSGQLDETMEGRRDTKIYKTGARRLENFSLMVQGGIRTRPGWARWGNTNIDSFTAILRPFVFDEDQTYIVRFKDPGGGGPTVIHVWQESTGSFAGPYSSPGFYPSNSKIRVAQRGDVMVVTDASGIYSPYVLTRTGALAFTFLTYPVEVDNATCAGSFCKRLYPFYKHAPLAVTLTPSATTGAITVTTSAAYWVSGVHNNGIIRYKGKQIQLLTYVSSTVMNAHVIEALPAITADVDWDEQAWGLGTGWPLTCAFHKGRFWFGGTRDLPSHMFSSKIGAFYNFDVGTGLDDESIQAPIDATSVNTIKHLVSHTTLAVFTDAAEFYIPETDSAPLTPSSFAPRRVSSYGSADAVPVVFDEAILFVQKNNAVVREFVYDDLQQNYTARAVSLVSTDIIQDVVETAVQYGVEAGSEQYAYFVRSDGSVAVYHGVRGENIRGMVPWTFYNHQGAVDHNCISLCVLGDKLYGYMECDHFSDRAVDKFGLCEFSYEHPFDDAQTGWSGDKIDADTWDFGVAYAGDDVWIGLAIQLNNIRVPMVWVGQKVVDVSGYINIAGADLWSDLNYGIPIQTRGELLPFQVEDPTGQRDGDPMRLIKATFKLLDCAAAYLGCRERYFTEKYTGSAVSDPSNYSAGPQNQMVDIWRLGWDREANICFGTDQLDMSKFIGLPYKVLFVNRKVEY